MGAIDHSEIQRLFRSYGPRLVLYARQWIGIEGAEDAVQEVFVRLMIQRHAPKKLAPWLFRAVRNEVMNQLRKRARRKVAAAGVGGPSWFENDGEARYESRLVEERMKSLSPETREVVILKVWGGLTFDEIASVTGMPTTTSFRRYREGLRDLRRAIGVGKQQAGNLGGSREGGQANSQARGERL